MLGKIQQSMVLYLVPLSDKATRQVKSLLSPTVDNT
jgi:hypothetical protein